MPFTIQDPNSSYFCLELSGHQQQAEVIKLLSLFKTTKIKFLDVQFNRKAEWGPEQLKQMVTVILKNLPETPVHCLDLSCNKLHLMGILGLEELLQSLPSNLKTLILSGNNWDKLGVSAAELATKIKTITRVSVLFEGTDEFEHQLSKALVQAESTLPGTENRYRMFTSEPDKSPERKAAKLSCSIQ